MKVLVEDSNLQQDKQGVETVLALQTSSCGRQYDCEVTKTR